MSTFILYEPSYCLGKLVKRHAFLILLLAGDLFDEEEVLEWLTNPENMEMDDAIERVNKRMFERILAKSEYLTVFFCKCSFQHGHTMFHVRRINTANILALPYHFNFFLWTYSRRTDELPQRRLPKLVLLARAGVVALVSQLPD